MPSPLDSGLVKALLAGAAGAVDSGAIEDAVNQQLIHGGALDTLLLEAGVIDEAGLIAALAASSQTASVDPDRFARPEPAAVARLPRRMAVTMGLVPLFVDADDDALHVGCRSPLDRDLIAEVAGLLKTRVVAHVVPEVRLRQGLAAAYEHELDERFVALLRRVSPDAAVSVVPGPSGPAVVQEPIVTWDLAEALAHLVAQDSRDGIARVAVAFARRSLPFAAVFGVRDGQAVGWLRQGPSEGLQFSQPTPIPPSSFLGPALQSPSPLLLTPEATDENALLFGWLGRRRPKTVLVIPIVVARRTVAILYGDGGPRHRDPRDVADLTAFGARLGVAFESLLRQRHRAHPSIFPQPATTLPPQPAADLVTTLPPQTIPPSFITTVLPQPASMPSMPPTTAAGSPPMPSLLAAPGGDDDANEADDDLPAPPALDDALPAPPALDDALPAPPTLDELPAPPALDEGPDGLDLPAPPPLASLTFAPPGGATMAMPSPGGPIKDGTSPFARSYRPPPTSPVAGPGPLAGPGDEDGPLILTGVGEPLNEHLPRLAQDASPPPRQRTQPFFPLEEGRAGEAWRGALHATVEQGLQGGTVVDEDLDWEAVVYDPAHAAELDKRATTTTTTTTRDGRSVDFPALSSNVLHDLYDRDRDGLIGADEVAAGPASPAPTGEGIAPPLPPLPTMSHADLVELLFAGDDALVERAARELVSRGLAVVPALGERFPGRLRVDPFDVGENVRTAERLGPLVDVLARLGRDGLDAAVPHVDSRYPAHRFAAVLLFALSPDARAIDLLRSRLHDAEPRIQRLAAEALVPFLAHPRFESLLVHLRERATAVSRPYPLESRRRAAELLGEFRDVGAVPLLMGLLGFGEMQETARKALRSITLVDHGSRPKGWEKWWQRARKRSRIDWLIDALSSEELELRGAAWRELQALAGDDFGYRPDADKRARQRAIDVWMQWWSDEQKNVAQARAAARG